MNAIILSGGLGTRLRPFTEVIPKPLLPIGEKAVLEIQIEHLKANGCEDLTVLHYQDLIINRQDMDSLRNLGSIWRVANQLL